MKLLGSRTENQIRDDLIRSNIALRDNIDGPLSEALQSSGIPVVDALVVNWVHEQAEDIYFVLLSDIELLLVQVSRLKLPVKIDRIGVESYGRNLTKVQRLKLTVALDLYKISRRLRGSTNARQDHSAAVMGLAPVFRGMLPKGWSDDKIMHSISAICYTSTVYDTRRARRRCVCPWNKGGCRIRSADSSRSNLDWIPC